MLEDVNIYDIYRYCWQDDSTYSPFLGGKFRNLRAKRPKSGLNNQPDPGRPPCTDDIGAYYFFNNQTTRNALHIWPNASIWKNHSWYMCADINYSPGPNASYWIYPHMIQKGYKILVYSGDTDAEVPIEGTIMWVQALNLTIKRPMFQWTLPGRQPNQPQVAGYAIYYNGLEFVTFRGVGHMVPQWNRQGALKVINAWINNQTLT